MDAFTVFCAGGGPVINGPVLPFIFITIACGAISGFHAIIATGTTPKMIGSEHRIPFVGYGAMITEGFVAIMALIAACVMLPADYYAINSSKEAFAALNMPVQELPALMAAVQEDVMHRPGGAVSLAVGMAHVFSSIPYMEHLMSYWYHFVIMFEAVFVLTAVDAGTRVGRFFLQELAGKAWKKFDDKNWLPGIALTSAVFTASWGYLVYTGNISSIWPLFGMSNQLLAACALIVVTTMLIRMGKARYVWSTAIPGLFMAAVTFWAGYLQIANVYLPRKEYLLAGCALIVIVLMFIVFVGAISRWIELLRIRTVTVDQFGEKVLATVEE
jgi:carbon starvation protein